MAQVINITDKLSSEKPKIILGEKEYLVNDGMETVLKFEELASQNSTDKMVEAISVALGQEAVEELNVRKMSVGNFKVLTIAILASMQGVSYEDADARFRKVLQ